MQRGRSNIVDGHLKGAMTIMTQNNHKPTPTSAFLERVGQPGSSCIAQERFLTHMH